MNNIADMLKTILESSHWTQEQLATELDVSFATVNSWINYHSIPRQSMQKKIEDLYLARRAKEEDDNIFITIVNCSDSLKVEDYILLEKDLESRYDDESICATKIDDTRSHTDPYSSMFVANSVGTVIRGTQSAGRIYDKITSPTKAQILFIHKTVAIAKLV